MQGCGGSGQGVDVGKGAKGRGWPDQRRLDWQMAMMAKCFKGVFVAAASSC